MVSFEMVTCWRISRPGVAPEPELDLAWSLSGDAILERIVTLCMRG